MKTLGMIVLALAVGLNLAGPMVAQAADAVLAQSSSTIRPMHIEYAIHCAVSGAGGYALYEGEQSDIIGVHSLKLIYVTSGFSTSKRRHWRGSYRWYTLELYTSGVGHVATSQCG